VIDTRERREVQEPRRRVACARDARLDATRVLPKHKVGELFMLSEGAALALTADRKLVETVQLAEPEIVRRFGLRLLRCERLFTPHAVSVGRAGRTARDRSAASDIDGK
jgi:hypothetical protein